MRLRRNGLRLGRSSPRAAGSGSCCRTASRTCWSSARSVVPTPMSPQSSPTWNRSRRPRSRRRTPTTSATPRPPACYGRRCASGSGAARDRSDPWPLELTLANASVDDAGHPWDLVLTGTDALAAGIEQGLWTELLPAHAAELPKLDEGSRFRSGQVEAPVPRALSGQNRPKGNENTRRLNSREYFYPGSACR